jgi:hypothetical protein
VVGNEMGDLNPEAWCANAEKGIAPIRLDHALLYGPDIEKAQASSRTSSVSTWSSTLPSTTPGSGDLAVLLDQGA